MIPTPRRTRRSMFGAVAAATLLVVTLVAGQPAGADPTLPAPGSTATTGANGRFFPRDDQGRALVLHGYNIKLHGDRIGTVTLDQLQGLRRNGFTVLRLAMFWADMEPTQGTWNDTYFDDLGHVLDLAETAGIRVVLDMHQDSYSPAVGGYGMPDWTTRTDGLTYTDGPLPCLNAANQRAWQHFYEDQDLRDAQLAAWDQVVTRLGNKPALYGYDLLNEPCGQANPGEDLTDALRRVETTQITPMLRRVTDAIRARDTTHWIFLEGALALTSSFAEPSGLGPVHDATGRQIYAPHIYDLAMEVGGDWDPTSDFVDRFYANVVTYGATNHIPTIVFEWGPQSPTLPNVENYVDRVMHGADTSTAGWAAFAWCQALAGWCQLDGDGNPGGGMTGNTQTYPTAIAGVPVSIAGDYAAGSSVVTVDPAGSGATGPTEFFFPLRRFPAGPDVSVDLPDDEWSSSWDPDTQILSVTVQATVRHTITVWQHGTTPPTTSTTTTSTTSTVPASVAPSTSPASSSTSSSTSTADAHSTTTGPTPSGPAGTLPKTGASTGVLVGTGVALIAAGLALDAFRRRRRVV